MGNDIPPIVAATFDGIECARNELAERFPQDFAELHPAVPFVVKDVPNDTWICVGLKGPIATNMPAHWRHDASSARFGPEEHRTLSAIANIIYGALSPIGVVPIVEFDDQSRIDEVGSFYYFR